MKNYEMKKIRNVAFVGASGAGKTTLIEHILFNTKAVTRIGKVEDGNTVIDFQPEEIEKGMSMTTAVAYADYKNHRLNFIDAPGYPDFAGEQLYASSAVETIAFVASAAAGYEVSLEQSIELLMNHDIAKALIINRMDSEGADFGKIIETIKDNSGLNIIPVYLPIGSESSFKGVVDVIKNKAIIDGKLVDVPAEMADEVEEARLALMEAVAESDDELMEKYFENGELSNEELLKYTVIAVNQGAFVPAFAVSATANVAVNALLDAIINYLPSPETKKEITVLENNEEKQIAVSPDGDVVALVFKSISDPTVGDIAYVRVFSGTITSGTELYVPEKASKERIGGMYYVLGKNRKDAESLRAGEIGGLVKLKSARTFNSLVSSNNVRVPLPELPSAVYWQTVKAVNQSDEDKIGAALTKIIDEDVCISLDMNVETNENVLSGIGEQQIQLVQKKLKSRYKIDAVLDTPSVPYKETIRGKADVSYKHKKQSGGKGQYGEVYFRVSPTERGSGFEFKNSIVGGTIPSKYIPAIEKGLKEIMADGIISGNPIVDICVDVYFGSYHDVDSSEMAFKIATWQCLKKAFEVANPILLEPVHEIQVIIPEEYMGDVMGDISTRRGKIAGMEQKGKKQILNAHMPLSELFSYYPALKSLTQGRGKFIQKFSHFEKVPDDVAQKVIAAANSDE